ncbi:hypothetical protein HDU85_005220 [Gaertneriomyces sp. JEL0708]|nr:hypothetical protein HDU85_005220 [Gaertneriomyces sp. JEL0708]
MYWIGGIGGLMGVYYWSHLEVVESTGRRRFIDVTPAQEEMMAKKAYQEVMLHNAGHILPSNHPLVHRVSRIAARLIATTPLQSLPWSLHIISSPTPNAFILPGGQIFVFTGLLSLTPSDSDIAAVLAHEIAHQLARHSAEKLSYVKILIVLGTLLTAVFDPGMVVTRLLLEYGLLRSGSRRMETEADYIGLSIMSRACFDPRAAVGVWQRMKHAEEKRGEGDNAKWMEYLSTHPSTERRIENLTEWMPEAEKLRIESGCEEISPMVDMFRTVRQGMW